MFHNKIIRDPIHDVIEIADKRVWSLINSAPFQRLRRIKQLGVCSFVFPGAEHTRFSHSLGVYHLSGRLIQVLKEKSQSSAVTRSLKKYGDTIRLAALCHDLGHGPFSHVFEKVLESVNPSVSPSALRHEKWTAKIIREHKVVSHLLNSQGVDANEVVKVIEKKHHIAYVNQIVSSQTDVDRFDYLLRDSTMTGAKYGLFDLEWMLLNLVLEDNIGEGELRLIKWKKGPFLAVDGKRGLSVLEQYLMGRYYMHIHVYFHKTIRSAELLVISILQRAADLMRLGRLKPADQAAWEETDVQSLFNFDHSIEHMSAPRVFEKMVKGEPVDVNEYLALDDVAVNGWIRAWSLGGQDPTLQDLSQRFVKREFFKSWAVPEDFEEYARLKMELEGLIVDIYGDPEYIKYYFLIDDLEARKYNDFFDKDGTPNPHEEILFLDERKNLRLLSSNKNMSINDITGKLAYKITRWCLPQHEKINRLCEKNKLKV
ncbi:MAG: HD domain-containing protein [Prosthecobacter sp.]